MSINSGNILSSLAKLGMLPDDIYQNVTILWQQLHIALGVLGNFVSQVK